MKTFLLLIFCLATTVGYVYGQIFEQRENTHRLMTYNISHGEGMDKKIDIRRIGTLIVNINPEVVALQEVDSAVNRSNSLYIMSLLAEQTKMYATFGGSILHDGGKYGNGILTKEKPIATRKINLSAINETGTVLIVELDRFVVVNTQLSLTNDEQKESVTIISDAIRNYDKPVFLMGDLNALPESDPIRLLEENYWQILSNPKTKTFPSEEPKETLDYILGYKGKGETYGKHQVRVIEEKIASDHRPLFVDIRLKTEASQVMRTIPYLQNPGTNEMTIMWLTNVPCRSWVEYGTTPDNMKCAYSMSEGIMVANNKINRIKLKDLEPGTKYYYRTVSQEITRYSSYYKEFGDTIKTDIKSFTTWDNNTDFRIAIFNDIHGNVKMFDKLFSHVENKPCDLVIFNGDCFDDLESENDLLKRLSFYTQRYKSDEVPSIFMRGNHETRGEYSPLLWNYIERQGGEHSYTSFSLGNIRFVLLDCGEDKPDNHWVYYGMNDFTQHRLTQLDFLKEELLSEEFKEANKRVLIHHIPIYGNKDNSYIPCTELWEPVLQNAPFNIALNGHVHVFRHIPKYGEGNNFPVVIGGGKTEETGTVMILEKRGMNMTLEVLSVEGISLLQLDL